MKRASKKTGRRLYQAGILEIYLLLYVFVKLQVFTSSQPSFTIFLPCSFPFRFLHHLFLSLSLKDRRPLRHLDRCICASLRRFLRRTYVWKFLKMLTRLHQILHVAEHLLNLLTLRASFTGNLKKILLPVHPVN